MERLNTHTELYEALRKVVENGDQFPEEDVDKHVAKLFLQGKEYFWNWFAHKKMSTE